MARTLEDVKDTVRKLLNLARNDAATEGEINNAFKFAHKMMQEHHLNEEDLGREPQSIEEAIQRAECGNIHINSIGAKSYSWEMDLCQFVTKFVGGIKCYMNKGQPRRENGMMIMKKGVPQNCTHYHFYGIREDAEYAAELYNEFSILVSTMAVARWGTVFTGSGKSYAIGFIKGLYDQIEVSKQELIGSSSTALVVRRNALISAKEQRALDFLKKLDLKLNKGQKRKFGKYDDEAYKEGRTDGKKVSIPGKTQKLEGFGQKQIGG